MTPLGRGLASLIPKRYRDSAQDILEQIDSIEEVTEAPEKIKRLRKARATVSKAASVEQVMPKIKRRQLSVVEEAEDDVSIAPASESASREVAQPPVAEITEEPVAAPEPPKTSPIPIEAEPSEQEAELFSLEEEASKPADEVPIEPQAETAVKPTAEPEAELPAAVSQEDDFETVLEKIKAEERAEAVEQDQVPAEHVALRPENAKVGDQRVLGERVEYIPIENIEVNPLQPRHVFDDIDLDDLVRSLDVHGMLQPLVVVKQPGVNRFQLIAGERRLRASKRLGWDKVPCVVRRDVASDRQRLELALTENIQRQNLNPIEEAMGYQLLNEEYGMTHEEIGQRVGRNRVSVTNTIRLLALPAEVQRGLIENKINMGQGRAILSIPDEDKQIKFYRHVVEEGLTVRKTELRARRIQRSMNLTDPGRQKMKGRPALAIKYDGLLQDKFGANVRVKYIEDKNYYEIVFVGYSIDETEQIIQRLLTNSAASGSIDRDVIDA